MQWHIYIQHCAIGMILHMKIFFKIYIKYFAQIGIETNREKLKQNHFLCSIFRTDMNDDVGEGELFTYKWPNTKQHTLGTCGE